MKRSEINRLITEAKDLLHRHDIRLPPFGYWSPAEWRTRGPECDEIRDCQLGWDITDFARGDFDRLGLVIFTVRNGHPTLARYGAKTYCEKLLIVREEQVTPMHYHKAKQEDIINRAGGRMVIELYNVAPDGGTAASDVTVSLDGIERTAPAGARLVLGQGESITLPAMLAHAFWAEKGSGITVLGEVSKVNDDHCDNFFIPPLPRFPDIEEDGEPIHLLCTEYPGT